MNKKIIVLDGLARSGSTLLSSVFHTQENTKCYRGVFHEFLSCDVGRWKRDYALAQLIPAMENVYISSEHSKLREARRACIARIPFSLNAWPKRKYQISLKRLRKQTLDNIIKRQQTDRINLEEWREFTTFEDITNTDELDNVYQILATKLDVEGVVFRWNQGFPYINKWLRNPNHYWISLVRDPKRRAFSDHKTFGESFENAVKYSDNYGKCLDEIKHKNHTVVYFEDLVREPETEVRRIFNFLDIPITEVDLDLVQQNGKPYRVESSDLIAVEGNHNVGREFNGFEQSKISGAEIKLDEKMSQKFNEVCTGWSVYSRYVQAKSNVLV